MSESPAPLTKARSHSEASAAGATFAVDVGGTWTRAAAVTGGPRSPGHVARVRTATTTTATLIDQIVTTVHAAAGSDLAGGVVATAGAVDTAGVITAAANLPLAGVNLAERLTARLSAPVTVIVDTAAAAAAEFSPGGAAAGADTGMYITVSTGIGAAIVHDGHLIAGRHHRAGELGHVPVLGNSRTDPCPCGQRGCLELYASGAGLARLSGQPDAEHVIAAANAGETTAANLVDQAITLLAHTLAGTIHVLDPDVIVLGGGLLIDGGLMTPVHARLHQLLAIPGWDDGHVIRAAAHGDRSVLAGAALLAGGNLDARRIMNWPPTG